MKMRDINDDIARIGLTAEQAYRLYLSAWEGISLEEINPRSGTWVHLLFNLGCLRSKMEEELLSKVIENYYMTGKF